MIFNKDIIRNHHDHGDGCGCGHDHGHEHAHTHSHGDDCGRSHEQEHGISGRASTASYYGIKKTDGNSDDVRKSKTER